MAAGLVRCGACLSVFEASENFVSFKGLASNEELGPDEKDSVFISPEEDYFDPRHFLKIVKGVITDEFFTTQTASLASAPTPEAVPAPAAAPTAEPVSDQTAVSIFTPAVSDSQTHHSIPLAVDTASSPPQVSSAEFSAIVAAAIDVMEAATETPVVPPPKPDQAVLNQNPVAPAATQDAEESKVAIRARLRKTNLREAESELERLSVENLAAIDNVSVPLQLPLQHRRRLQRKLVMGFFSLLLLASLLGQFLWQRQELMSQHPLLRPWYQLACNYLPCRLPAQEDIARIVTDSLVIRAHTELADTRVVTTVIRNTASFQQPFPNLHLRFSDLNNRSVAGREFLPSEYLPVALRSIRYMPVNAAVQITLELVDPGPEAINYELQIQSSTIQ